MKQLTWNESIDTLFSQFTEVIYSGSGYEILKLSPECMFDYTERSQEIAACLISGDRKPPKELMPEDLEPGDIGEMYGSAAEFLNRIIEVSPRTIDSKREMLWNYDVTGFAGSIDSIDLYFFNDKAFLLHTMDSWTLDIYAIQHITAKSDLTLFAFRMFIKEAIPDIDLHSFKWNTSHINEEAFVEHLREWAKEQKARTLNHVYDFLQENLERRKSKPPSMPDNHFKAMLDSEVMAKADKKIDVLVESYWHYVANKTEADHD